MSMKFTQQNFREEVLESKDPVLIDFYADRCAPCRMIAPIVEEIAGEVSGVKVGKINVDEEPGLAGEFRVMSIPTLVVMKDGKPVKTMVGVQPKKEILNMLEL